MRRLAVPAALLGAILLLALLAPVLGLPDPVRQDVARRLSAPNGAAWLGRDEFGRDELSRLVWGARTSLAVAFVSSAVAALLGTTLGLLGGWSGGLRAVLAVRSVDVVLCFPPVLLSLLVVTLLGPGAPTLILVLSVLFLPGFARVAYAEVLSARQHDYVDAVRALGASGGRILLRTVLPNIAGPVLVQLSLAVASAVVLESGLSFLGLGVVPPTPSWGLMIRSARATMAQAPLLLLWPCASLTLTILSMNLLCDALRDVFDPRGRVARPVRRLSSLVPGLRAAAPPCALLDVRGLTVEIATPRGPIRPVEDVSFSLEPRETLAIVGESGSGKSVTATALMGLLPPAAHVAAGQVRFEMVDLIGADEKRLRALRGGPMAMIFQDPMSSLNPVLRAGEQVAEAIRAHRTARGRGVHARAVALFRQVGIAAPERRLRSFPHEMSGGMRQRVMIAMALANDPKLLIADEPTTALDVTVQAQVLDLLLALKRDRGTATVFISHSLGVVAEIADRVLVMYAGLILEQGATADVFGAPLHPYTRALLAAVPDGTAELARGIPGVVPPPHAFPAGCRFAPRCSRAVAACTAALPALEDVSPGRTVRCIRWREA